MSEYDNNTTMFTPDGRIMQIEYALEGINKQVPTVGVLSKEGVVLGAERAEKSPLIDDMKEMGKMYKLDEHCFTAVSGLIADATTLVSDAREAAQSHLFTYKKLIPVEQLVQSICEHKHFMTQVGSYRPFGVSFMYAGYDPIRGFQLYNSDPSGNYSAWKAHATGMNNMNAITILKQDYEEEISLQNALKLAVKVVAKTIDSHEPNPEKFEIAYLAHEDGRLAQKELTKDEVKEFLDQIKKE